MSGNTDFWRNDLFTRTSQPAPGNKTFGADRRQPPGQTFRWQLAQLSV